jgi:hypothetical protein
MSNKNAETRAMRTKTPRFYLDGPHGCETLATADESLIVAGFSNHGAAAYYGETDAAQVWQLCPLERFHVSGDQPKLLALDPTGGNEFTLLAATFEAVAAALKGPQETVEAEFRLVRDCAKHDWRCEKLGPAAEDSPGCGQWCVGCRYPRTLTLVCGGPMWYWSEWFDGRHVRTDHQKEHDADTDQAVFAFDSQQSAEAFGQATIARLDGSVRHCYVDKYAGSPFEVAVWEDGQPVRSRTSGHIGQPQKVS